METHTNLNNYYRNIKIYPSLKHGSNVLHDAEQREKNMPDGRVFSLGEYKSRKIYLTTLHDYRTELSHVII